MTMANTLNYLKVSLFRTTNTMLITFRITFSSFTTSRSVIRSFNIFSFHNHWERFLESGIVKKYALCFFSASQGISSSLWGIRIWIRRWKWSLGAGRLIPILWEDWVASHHQGHRGGWHRGAVGGEGGRGGAQGHRGADGACHWERRGGAWGALRIPVGRVGIQSLLLLAPVAEPHPDHLPLHVEVIGHKANVLAGGLGVLVKGPLQRNPDGRVNGGPFLATSVDSILLCRGKQVRVEELLLVMLMIGVVGISVL